MTKKQLLRGLSVLSQTLVLLLMSVLSAQSFAANYELEIIQPQPNLNTLNRFYKAYPGIEYNVRIGVIGGSYTYKHTLTTSPTGMSINVSTGEITWSNPTTSGSPHSVTVQVEDQEGSVDTVSWTITATTSGFKFVDSTVGSSGDGSISSPYKTLEDVYDSASSSDFIYFRSGSYSVPTLPSNNNWDGSSHATVWMGYPGETATFDFSTGNSYGIFFLNSTNTLYLDKLNIDVNNNTYSRGFVWPGGMTGVVVRRCIFEGLVANYTNSSYMFSTADSNPGNYTAIQDNTANNGGGGYFFLGYNNSRVLVEDNETDGLDHGISPKDGNNYWWIRDNTILNSTANGIDIQGYDSRGVGNADIVVEYNYISQSSATGLSINSNGSVDGNIYIQRNTIDSDTYVRDPTTGSVTYTRNVIVNNNSSYTDRIRLAGTNTNIDYVDALTGSGSDGIVDSKGSLTPNYGSYIGVRGHMIGTSPKSPIGVRAVTQ